MIISQVSNTNKFYQTSDSKSIESKSETSKEKSTIESSNDRSSCLNTLSYPFAKVKEVISFILNQIFSCFCCCSRAKVDLEQELKTVTKLRELTDSYYKKGIDNPKAKQIRKDFYKELNNLDLQALKIFYFRTEAVTDYARRIDMENDCRSYFKDKQPTIEESIRQLKIKL